MTWSEFGRRVTGNASGGTDHGSAGPMFLAGTPIAGGFYGERPSLKDLDENNLKFTTDFRQVYATVLEDWLAAPGRHSPRRPIRAPAPAETCGSGSVALAGCGCSRGGCGLGGSPNCEYPRVQQTRESGWFPITDTIPHRWPGLMYRTPSPRNPAPAWPQSPGPSQPQELLWPRRPGCASFVLSTFLNPSR